MAMNHDDVLIRAEQIATLSATLMAGWLSNPSSEGGLPNAPIREIVELAEKILGRAEQRARAKSTD